MQEIEEALDTKAQKYVSEIKVTICKDPQDNFLIELAEEANADFIISGDKLVLDIKEYKNTKIVSPKEFIQLLK